MATMQRITANLVGAQTRREFLDGKEYLVVPTVMLTEGVHNGTQGPLYYSPIQLAKNTPAWNLKPIVIRHPVENGAPVSACNPAIIEKQGVGLMMNSDFDGRLKTESWLDEPKLKRLQPDILEAINRGENVEVSTGLWNDLDPTPGVWNTETYTGSVINIIPDHLALLPDEKGACSIADGAGLLRNAETVATGPNDLSFDDIREQVRAALRAAMQPNDMDYVYVCDIFKTYAVYEKGMKCYQVKYIIKNGTVALSKEEPIEVRKVTSYMTANELMVGSGNNLVFDLPITKPADKIATNSVVSTSKKQETPMTTQVLPNGQVQNTVHQGTEQIVQAALATPANTNDPVVARKSAIDQLIELATATEADRPALQNMNEHEFKGAQAILLRRIANNTTKYTTPAPAAQPTPMTVEQWLQTLPPAIATMVTNSLARDEEEKTKLVVTITANKANMFTPEWLKAQDVNMLRAMAAIAGQQQVIVGNNLPNYSGQGGPPMFLPNAGQPTQNAGHQQPCLPIPKLFTEPAQAS